MKAFPEKILIPSTAHRIPRTESADRLVARVLEFGNNASAFVMDEDLLAKAEAGGFSNDLDCALRDLLIL